MGTNHNLVQGADDLHGRRLKFQCVGGMPEIFGDLGRPSLRRGNDVGNAGLNGTLRHAFSLYAGVLLNQRQSGIFLDGARVQVAS